MEKKECIFCQIVRGESPGELIYEGENLVAFKDIKPHAPVHILLVPKKHIRSINDLEEEDRTVLSDLVFAAKKLAVEQGIDKTGYKLVYNVERGGGQFVFHLHLHLLGGWK
ncbi:MAG: histidine triad nucleotide-binding protein [Gammaproteobacteria bacterium]